MLDWPIEEIQRFADSVEQLKEGPVLCKQCFNFADAELCGICSNPKRKTDKIAVVERVTDLVAMEKTGAYDGVYHVLGGAINPVGNVLPERLKINQLLERASALLPGGEIILATNPNTYGETTALYLEQELSAMSNKPSALKITRLARGLAAGTSVEYADEITLANALKHRR